MLLFSCSHCGLALQTDDSYAGKTHPCPVCHAPITAPSASAGAGANAWMHAGTSAPQMPALPPAHSHGHLPYSAPTQQPLPQPPSPQPQPQQPSLPAHNSFFSAPPLAPAPAQQKPLPSSQSAAPPPRDSFFSAPPQLSPQQQPARDPFFSSPASAPAPAQQKPLPSSQPAAQPARDPFFSSPAQLNPKPQLQPQSPSQPPPEPPKPRYSHPPLPSKDDAPRRRFFGWLHWPRPAVASAIAMAIGGLGGWLKPLQDNGRPITSDADELSRRVSAITASSVAVLLWPFLIAVVLAVIPVLFRRPYRQSVKNLYAVFVLIGAPLFLVMMLGEAVAAKRETHKAAQAVVANLEADYHRMAQDAPDSDGTPKANTNTNTKAPTPRLTPGNRATNDMLLMQQLVQGLMADIVKVRNQYELDLDKAGAGNLLSPNRLVGDTDFQESHRMLADMRNAVQTAKTRAEVMMTSFPEKINALDLTENARESMQRGYQNGIAASFPRLRESWELEIASVEFMAKMVTHLEATRPYWTVQEGQYLFQRDEDLQTFQNLLVELHAGMNRQKENRSQTQQRVQTEFSEAKDSLRMR